METVLVIVAVSLMAYAIKRSLPVESPASKFRQKYRTTSPYYLRSRN